MTDDVQEGAPAAEELKELAAPEVSETDVEVQQPSVAESGLTEERVLELLGTQFKALEEKIENFSRQAQSVKDRAISKNAKELADIKARLEAVGGDWGALSQEAEQDSLAQRLEQLEARISQTAASQRTADPKAAWTAEWSEESQKVLDAAEKLGITLSTEEYNAVFLGRKFKTKGDAYAALNQAMISKAKGEAMPTAAVATEGGEVAQPPERSTPKTFREKFDQAREKGDTEARKLLDERWAEVDKLTKVERARKLLAKEGVSPEDLS